MAEAREQSLSLAFMQAHPAQAARVLEALPASQAAALFARAPARIGAPVLAAMLPQSAARCLAALDDPRVLELLAPLGAQPTVALLRYLDESRRRTLIGGLSTTAALATSLLLGYADDTLGAWADPDVIALGADVRAIEAVQRLRQSPTPQAQVFVTDTARRLAGVVGLPQLLRAAEAASLATLMGPPPARLSAHSPLAGSAAHPGWEQASLLPVVDPGGRLVGVMTRDALARALRLAEPPPADGSSATLPALFARAYWQTLSGLLGSALALLPRVPAASPAARPDDGR